MARQPISRYLVIQKTRVKEYWTIDVDDAVIKDFNLDTICPIYFNVQHAEYKSIVVVKDV